MSDLDLQAVYPNSSELFSKPGPSSTMARDDAALRQAYGENSPELFGEKPAPAAETKPADEAKAAPDGGETSTEAPSTDFQTGLAKLGLDEDKAKAVADLHAADERAMASEAEGWRDLTKNDEEIGGAHLEESLKMAKGVLDEHGTEALREMLNGHVGNHPEVVRFLARVGRALRDRE